MRKLRILAIAVATAFLFGALAPAPAHAKTDVTTTVIIVVSVVGGLAVIALVATLIMRRDKKIFRFDPAQGQRSDDPLAPKGGVRIGLDCPPTADGRPLVCW